jgi:hypothetical protein
VNAVVSGALSFGRGGRRRFRATLAAVPVRTVARSAVLAVWLLALAVTGRPAWLALLLGAALVALWAAPLALATQPPRERPAPAAPGGPSGG